MKAWEYDIFACLLINTDLSASLCVSLTLAHSLSLYLSAFYLIQSSLKTFVSFPLPLRYSNQVSVVSLMKKIHDKHSIHN